MLYSLYNLVFLRKCAELRYCGAGVDLIFAQNLLIFDKFPELRYCGAGMIPDFLLLVSLGPWAAWAAWRAWAAWAASAAWVAWAA